VYTPTLKALRLVKDEAFPRQELERVALLSERLKADYRQKRRHDVEAEAYAQSAGFPQPNDARRALRLLADMRALDNVALDKHGSVIRFAVTERVLDFPSGTIAADEPAVTAAPAAADPVVEPDAQQVPAEWGFFGRWRLTGVNLGEGGQGSVDLVVDDGRGIRGALKRMSGPRAGTAKARERFLREIQAVSQIDHPFVARVIEAGNTPEPFLVMPVVRYGSLHKRRTAFTGDLWRCLRMVRSLALGLGAAHKLGIVHRDVKPKNVLLDSLDHPLVSDFGVAHFVDLDTITSLGAEVGAFLFAPPEWEHFDVEPTPAFDVFSLGAMLHWAVTGENPVRPYRLTAQLSSTGEGAAAAATDALIASMVAVDVAKRPQQMDQVVKVLDQILARFGDRAVVGNGACACGQGQYRELGTVRLGSGTEVNIHLDASPSVRGLPELQPILDVCKACGALRLRTTKASSWGRELL
jgi:hypothetical protein